MMTYALQLLHAVLDYGWRIFYASMIFFAAEMIFGRNSYTLMSRLKAAWYWLVYIVITVLFYSAFNRIWHSLGIKPWLSVDLSGWSRSGNRGLQALGWIVVPVTVVVISEFFYYWFHRLQHRSAFLWTFHSEHHSLREMSAWNSNHHFTEELFRIPFVTIPMSLLFHFDTGFAPAIVWVLIGMQGQFEHSHTRLNLGWLRYVIADNRYHRIHHSVETRHYNRNFGSFTSIWDHLFGTAHFPAADEWPDTGIDAHGEPRKLSEFLFRPWRKLLGS